jgi:hypothetical protein
MGGYWGKLVMVTTDSGIPIDSGYVPGNATDIVLAIIIALFGGQLIPWLHGCSYWVTRVGS